jgi:hypothetical protein
MLLHGHCASTKLPSAVSFAFERVSASTHQDNEPEHCWHRASDRAARAPPAASRVEAHVTVPVILGPGSRSSWAALARVDRARGARGPLTLRLAGRRNVD